MALTCFVIACIGLQRKADARLIRSSMVQAEVSKPIFTKRIHVLNPTKDPNRMSFATNPQMLREIDFGTVFGRTESNARPNGSHFLIDWRYRSGGIPRVVGKSDQGYGSYSIGWRLAEVLKDNLGDDSALSRLQRSVFDGDIRAQLPFGGVAQIVALPKHNSQDASVNKSDQGSNYNQRVGRGGFLLFCSALLLGAAAISIAGLGWWLLLADGGYRNPWGWLILCCGAAALWVWSWFVWSLR
jgi:hypothetical protein